jgi:hypothetical protein
MLVGQSRDDLKRAYGEPIAETFAVGPDIQVTVRYAGGVVTELIVAPRTNGAEIVRRRGDGLSREAVDAVINELAPIAVRGKYVIGEFIDMDCIPADDCYGTRLNYERLDIYYNSAPKGRVYYAVVTWHGKPVRLPIPR